MFSHLTGFNPINSRQFDVLDVLVTRKTIYA